MFLVQFLLTHFYQSFKAGGFVHMFAVLLQAGQLNILGGKSGLILLLQ